MTSKRCLLIAAVLSMGIVAHPALANHTGGCSDSPENPTLILAGLASGAYAVSAIRTRLRARRRAHTE